MQDEQLISKKRKFQVEEAILIFLLILSIVGISITDFSPDDGYGYWIIMAFVFALFAILIAWLQSKHRPGDFTKIVKHQCQHWATTLLVIGATLLLQKSGHIIAESSALVILLLLSLAIMLDGLRIGWRFSLLGLFLGCSSVIAAFFELFLLINIIIAILIIFFTFLAEYLINKRADA